MKTSIRIGLTLVILAMLVSPVKAYVTLRTLTRTQEIVQMKWAPGAITWRLNPIRGDNVTGSRTLAAVFQQAFGAWAAVPTASLIFAQGPDTDPNAGWEIDNINTISTYVEPGVFAPGVVARAFTTFYSDAGGVDDFGNPIEFAGKIVESDILFSGSELFSTDAPNSDRFDLQSVAMHEIGHMLGLEHTTITSSTMNWSVAKGTTHARVLSMDDMAGISTIYPSAAFAAKGTISGTVRNTTNTAVYGAVVTAVNANGQPVASAISNPSGQYIIQGLDAGAYTIYAEPLDLPVGIGNVSILGEVYPSAVINTSFRTTFR